MKIKAIKEVIPEHTVEKEVYVCETCGTEYDRTYHLDKCSVCNKEVCTNCYKICYVADDTLCFDSSAKTFTLLNDEDGGMAIKVCETCYNKIKANEQAYVNQITKLIDDFHERLEQLNTKYLKGECK